MHIQKRLINVLIELEVFFEKPFKRIRITNENYLLNLVLYIHLNPEHHNLAENFQDYKYSSYIDIIQDNTSLIAVKSVIDFFNDRINFIDTHVLRKVYLDDKNLTFE